jgi:hypothetical protein
MINRIARPWILESNASYRARIHLPAAARVSNAQKNYVWRPYCRFFEKKEKRGPAEADRLSRPV